MNQFNVGDYVIHKVWHDDKWTPVLVQVVTITQNFEYRYHVKPVKPNVRIDFSCFDTDDLTKAWLTHYGPVAARE